MAIQISVLYFPKSLSDKIAEIKQEFKDIKVSSLLLRLGKELDRQLQNRASTIIKLENDGWMLRHFGDKTVGQHSDVKTEKMAYTRLQAIGINPDYVIISTTWDDWFDETNEPFWDNLLDNLKHELT